MAKNDEKIMEKIVTLCKNRGFIYAGSEIYGGLANTWDYGPLGVEFKNNIKLAWKRKFIQESDYNVGLDAAILMNPQTWVASGHADGFSDPLMDCRQCKTRHRADKLIEDAGGKAADKTFSQMSDYIKENNIRCPDCDSSDFTEIRNFNLMFETFQGVTKEAKSALFLRPETAQGIFVNFSNILRSTRKKLPFGVGQIGKSFRNEITPGNFIFRTREFEQMELEFFFKPGEDLDWFIYWEEFCKNWLLSLGMNEKSMRLRDHDKEELSHYSDATTDIEFLFPFGWGELWGIACRGDFDLKAHQTHSGKSLEYFDAEQNSHYLPHVIEPALGADRVALAFFCDAYEEEQLSEGEIRVVLRLHPTLAPYKAAVMPLSKKLGEKALEIKKDLSKDFMIDYDDAGSIGKRYRRQDEIGTPFCLTYDFESLNDESVTVRDRDTMKQERIKIENLKSYIQAKLIF
jgi:glycyl-tRNA synthetase